jgi:hypothetical protein
MNDNSLDAHGFARVRITRDFAFTGLSAGWNGEGVAPDNRQQCEESYAGLECWLGAHGLSNSRVARLDHFTSSQAWLGDRQAIRARFFGSPCRLSSTGVAVEHVAGTALKVSAIASRRDDPKVLVAGADFGMPAISAAVEVGGYLFVSGILKTGASGSGNITEAVAEIFTIARRAGFDPGQAIRCDAWLGSCGLREPALDALRKAFGLDTPIFYAILPFPSDTHVEITTIFGRDNTGALEAIRPVGGSLEDIAAHLETVIRTNGRSKSIARIDFRYPPGDEWSVTRLAELLHVEVPPVCVAIPGRGHDPFYLSGFLTQEFAN